MARLDGKTALITGGTTGIGFASAKLFLQEGAKVAIAGQDEARLKEAVTKLGGGVAAIRADMRSLSDLDNLALQAKQTLGAIDVLFVNAGIAKAASLAAVTEAHYEEEMGINFKGAFFTIQKLEPLMRDGGSIVLNTTTLDQTGMAGMSIYSASKAALRSLARTLSMELIDRKIRVNAVAPGPIDTPIWGKTGVPPEAMPQMSQQVLQRTPAGRFGQPEEIASAVLFLASDDSSFMLGEEILVDGGWATL